MIKLKTIKQYKDGIKDQFIIEADEPVVIEVVNTEEGHGHLFAHVYQSANRDEPIGMYDSEVGHANWVHFNPDETPEAPQWRVFMNKDQITDIDYLETSAVTTRMVLDDFTTYHSFETETEALSYVFENQHRTSEFSSKNAVDRVVEIKLKLAKSRVKMETVE